MPTTFSILAIRQRLGRDSWGVPIEFGIDGWRLENLRQPMRILISDMPGSMVGDPHDWIHASMSHRDRIPAYGEMVMLHKAIWPDGYAYEVHSPDSAHVNIHDHALHLWGRADGSMALPNFAFAGTI